MRFIFFVVFFLVLCAFATGQRISKTDSVGIINKKNGDLNKGLKIREATKWYSETVSNGLRIQNSFPKGGNYIDSAGRNVGYRIFFTRIISETAAPLELTINFPADSFAILPPSDSYLKLFLAGDTMTLDKGILYDYGLNLNLFLDAGLNKVTMLQKVISPNEEYLFYIVALFYQSGGVVPRAEFVLQEQDLFYRINLLDPALIPCGKIISKK